MSSFDGRLRMPGLSRLPVGVVVDIADERMTLVTGDRELGTWPLSKVAVSSEADGFHLKVEDEEVILSVVDSSQFAAELGIPKRHPNPSRPRIHAVAAVVTEALVEPKPDAPGNIEARIASLREDMMSESVAPPEVLGRWLGLLKEINDRHGRGQMATSEFYRLNTGLLELIPEPAVAHSVPASA